MLNGVKNYIIKKLGGHTSQEVTTNWMDILLKKEVILN